MRVYFVGASGTGKTTLAKHVASRYGLKHLPSAARYVMEGLGWSDLSGLAGDLEMADTFQWSVFNKQVELEEAMGADFVSDRAFDHIAYASGHSKVAGDIVRHPRWLAQLDRLRQTDTLIFFCRPHGSSLSRVDEVQSPFTSPGWQMRVDGVVQYVLESNNLQYAPLPVGCLRDRVRLVDLLVALKKEALHMRRNFG